MTFPAFRKSSILCRRYFHGGSLSSSLTKGEFFVPPSSTTPRRFFGDNNKNNNWKPKIRGTIPEDGYGVAVGQTAEAERTFSEQDVQAFANIVGDHNLLHKAWDWEIVSTQQPSLWTNFNEGLIELQADGMTTKPMVHGILVASLFSTIFGTLVPGCVYMNQKLDFSSPVFVDDPLVARIEIIKLRRWRKEGVVVECDTQILRSNDDIEDDNVLVIKGRANVWLPGGSPKDK
jgi:acyl dehydratase